MIKYLKDNIISNLIVKKLVQKPTYMSIQCLKLMKGRISVEIPMSTTKN